MEFITLVPCLIALIILSALGIFSLKYRVLAREAFDCVFRRVTFRPCETGFNQKIKIAISSWFLKKNEKIGGFVFRRFEILSWFFVLLFFASGVYAGRGVYFYAKYGTCDPASPETCPFGHQLITPPGQTPSCEEVDEKANEQYQSGQQPTTDNNLKISKSQSLNPK